MRQIQRYFNGLTMQVIYADQVQSSSLTLYTCLVDHVYLLSKTCMLIICWQSSIQFNVLFTTALFSCICPTFKKCCFIRSIQKNVIWKRITDLFYIEPSAKIIFYVTVLYLTPLTEYTSLQLIQKASFFWSLLSNATEIPPWQKPKGHGGAPGFSLCAILNTVSEAESSISRGLWGLKLKIPLKSASPTIKLSFLQLSLPPPCSRRSQPKIVKSCRHRTGDELGVDSLWWQRRILLFPNPHTTPSPCSPYKTN